MLQRVSAGICRDVLDNSEGLHAMTRRSILVASLLAALSAFYLHVLYLAATPQVSNVYKAYYMERKLRTWNHGNGPTYTLGQVMDFSEELPWLSKRGWSRHEKDGTWSDGKSAEIFLCIAAGAKPAALTIAGFPFTAPRAQINSQLVKVYINGIYAGSHVFSSDEEVSFNMPQQFEGSQAADGLTRIRFEFPNAASPKDLGVSSDSRDLGLYFRKLVLK
jgi:hypothetical protein